MSRPGYKLCSRLLIVSSLCCGFQMLFGCSGMAVPTVPPVTVTVTGANQVRVGETVQLIATVANSVNTTVQWQVNGTTGGSATIGTISTSGLYKAPVLLPSPSTVTITAANKFSGITASLVEQVLNPVPVLTSATAVLTAPNPNALLDVKGSAFVAGAQVQVAGVSLATTVVSPTELQASVVPAPGVATLAISVANPDPGSSVTPAVVVNIQTYLASAQAASRLLDQAAFGPTMADIKHVQTVGLEAYLNEQLTTPPTLMTDVLDPVPPSCVAVTPIPCLDSLWWQAALTAPDQLRQRVALALSEIFVISLRSVTVQVIPPFQNALLNDAFGNFSTLFHDVTLSTGMGNYLNVLNSAAPGPGQIANENYAREGMQLFAIGLYQLNQDGTPMLDASGNLIPTYTQAQVQAFARAYTGWTYATATGTSPTNFPNYAPNYDHPMMPVESKHDKTVKTLLNGTTLPAGQTAEEDLAGALANIVAHDNVGPFICRQLIQHLVSSNPSPAYVARISAIFADNGQGVRGDLRTVLRAILLDPEARAGDTDPTLEGGHLREPSLYLANVLRGLGYVNTDVNGYYGVLSVLALNVGESPYESGSVFNFFPPDYQIPGSTATSPEFDIENTASVVLRLTLANILATNELYGFNVDLSATGPLGLLAKDPGSLVDQLSLTLMHGQMPAPMKTTIVNHISTLTGTAQRVRVAIYLIVTSSLYKVQH